MPHITLEYTDNIPLNVNAQEFFAGFQEILESFDAFRMKRAKSRIICHHEYSIEGGDPADAFVYLQIAILSGRSIEIRQELSRRSIDYLMKYFETSIAQLECSISVEVREIEESTFNSMARLDSP